MFTSSSSPVLGVAARAAIAALMFFGGSACQDVECGEGTFSDDDECLPAAGRHPRRTCGAGTTYSASEGACIPILPPAECGPNTVEERDEDGTIICVGVGGGGCASRFRVRIRTRRRPPRAGKSSMPRPACLCRGRRHGSDSPCLVDDPAADGPCSLELILFDALQFATNPDEADELRPMRS